MRRLLCDSIAALWAVCDLEREIRVRGLHYLLMDFGASAGLEQAQGNVAALRETLRQERARNPPFFKFMRKLCDIVGRARYSEKKMKWKPALALFQSVARLSFLALRQCRLFERVGVLYASDSATVYAEDPKKLMKDGSCHEALTTERVGGIFFLVAVLLD